MKMVSVIWCGPDDTILPGIGVGMKGKPISMPEEAARSYKAVGLVAEEKAAASKDKTKEKDK